MKPDTYGRAELIGWRERTWPEKTWNRPQPATLFYAAVRCVDTGKRFLEGWHWRPETKMAWCPYHEDWHWLEGRAV